MAEKTVIIIVVLLIIAGVLFGLLTDLAIYPDLFAIFAPIIILGLLIYCLFLGAKKTWWKFRHKH